MSHQKVEEKKDTPTYREGNISEDLKQSFMDCQISCTSPLPWIWVVDTLARSNQVDFSVLLDLLEKTPEISDDIGRNARELVSLRILESFSVQGARANSVSSAGSPKLRFDPCERCEDVLRRILSETSASNLKPSGPEMWKWDVQPFIKQKRSSLGKYALQQLKDTILTGSHSFLASLKAQSGLPVGNQPEHGAPVGHHDTDGITHTLEGSDTNGSYVLHRDFPDENLSPVTRKRRATTEKAGEESCKHQIISKNGCKTHIKSVKKYKQDIIGDEHDVGGKLIASGVDTQLADTSATFMQHSEGERCRLGKKINSGGMGQNGPPKDDNSDYTLSKGLVGPDEVLSHEKQVPPCDSELNNRTEEEEGQDQDIEEAKGDKEGFCNLKTTKKDVDKFEPNIQRNVPNVGEVEDVDISSDNDGDNDGRTAIATKNNASFSHRRGYNQDFLAKTNLRDLNLLADACKRIGQSIEEERCSPGQKHVGDMGQNGPPEDGNNECTSSKGLDYNGEVLPHKKQAPHCGSEVPNGKFDGEQRQDHDVKNADKKGLSELITTNEDMDKSDQNIRRNVPNVGESENEVNSSSDSDGYQDERTDIDRKKKTFLSSQCTYSQDSLATTDWRETNLCMKCNKGGKLLACSSNSCPIVIHESCMDSDASFDTRGKFYCPFCAYSRAISKYTEIKKKSSLARQDLATFICLGNRKGSKTQSCRSCRLQENHLEQDEGLPKSSELNDRDFVKKVGHRHRKKLEYAQAGPSVLSSGYTPAFGGNNVDSTNGTDKREGKRMRQVSQSPRVRELQMTAPAIRKSKNENISCQVPERSDGNEKHAEIRSKKGVLCPPQKDLPREKCSPSNQSADGEELSEEENENSHASKYFIRVRKQEGHYSYPAIPQLRRKRLPWTSAEEEALKEGMRKFSSPHDKAIPWTKILEFGAEIFQKSRNTMDLKDKWRNMCKAAPKS